MKKRIRAAILSLIIPGTGQIYRKRYFAGFFFLVLNVASLWYIRIFWKGFLVHAFFIYFSLLLFWILNVIDAYRGPYFFRAPCDRECPAGIDPSFYVARVSNEEFNDGLKELLDECPFPGVLGRICPAPCEFPCSRSGYDEEIKIRYLKRFLDESADYGSSMMDTIQENGYRVAIIGAGMAGLSCAYNLRKKGYEVTVFEKEEMPGGMPYYGIPAYRSPESAVSSDVRYVLDTGVNIKTGVEIGNDIQVEKLLGDYNAVFLSIGRHLCNKLNIGEFDIENTTYGVPFLKRVKAGEVEDIGREVIVIGGGNVAIDSARTAVRLGARNVEIISLESREEMLAFEDKIEKAEKEGVKVTNGWGPYELMGEKIFRGAKFRKCTKVFDENGNISPEYSMEDTMEKRGEFLIICTGQLADSENFPDDILDDEGNVLIDRNFMTPVKGLFAGGDCVRVMIAAEAVGMGLKASRSIDFYLRGFKARWQSLLRYKEFPELKEEPDRIIEEEESLNIPYEANLRGFSEEEQLCSREEGIRESKRCLNCPVRFTNF